MADSGAPVFYWQKARGVEFVWVRRAFAELAGGSDGL
jgi:hypothetical protein